MICVTIAREIGWRIWGSKCLGDDLGHSALTLLILRMSSVRRVSEFACIVGRSA